MIAKPLRYRRSLVLRVGIVTLCLVPVMAWAASENPAELNWLKMAMELFGGLAIFLFGMEQMSDGLKAAAGDSMKTLLSKLTKNRFSAAITGAFVTSVIQSSSVTTVLVVGFDKPKDRGVSGPSVHMNTARGLPMTPAGWFSLC